MSATEGTLDVTTDPDLNASINEALADNGLSGEPGDDLAAGDGSSVEPTGSGEPLPRDDGVVPGASVAGAPAAPDPAAEPVSEPFRFDANGVERTEDGWRVFPGDGLYIPFTEMPRLQQAMSRIAASEAILRDAHTKTQEYDTLSSWQIKGPNGQPETITGPRALLERHAATAVLAATTSIYRNIFAGKPEEVAERLAGFYLQLPNGQVVANAQAIRNLQLEVQLAARDSDSRARAQFGNVSRGAPAAAPPSAPSQGNGNASPEVVTHLANGWGIQGLSTEDVPVLTPGYSLGISGRPRRTMCSRIRCSKSGSPSSWTSSRPSCSGWPRKWRKARRPRKRPISMGGRTPDGRGRNRRCVPAGGPPTITQKQARASAEGRILRRHSRARDHGPRGASRPSGTIGIRIYQFVLAHRAA